MLKIKLFCSAGMSTSLLVNKMREVAKKRGMEVEVNAYPESKIDQETNGNDCDVALLGPQVRYLLAKAKDICEPKGIPVDVIPMQAYGTMNGEQVLDMAMAMKNV